jgi:hypothetical protein
MCGLSTAVVVVLFDKQHVHDPVQIGLDQLGSVLITLNRNFDLQYIRPARAPCHQTFDIDRTPVKD